LFAKAALRWHNYYKKKGHTPPIYTIYLKTTDTSPMEWLLLLSLKVLPLQLTTYIPSINTR
jgi:hypothetical protein